MTTSSTAFVVATSICLMTTTAAGDEFEGAPLIEPIDPSQLRTTWRNLANEQVMFPLHMKDMPVKIGRERQLFLDNYLIAESENVTRLVHQPKRVSKPVLTRGKNSDGVIVLQVRRFETSPKFRMSYWSWRRWHKLPSGQEIRFATSYATSEDGVHWKVPNLDLFEIEGMADRNVVIPYGLMHGLFYEPD